MFQTLKVLAFVETRTILKREKFKDYKVKRIIVYYLVDWKVFVLSFLFSVKKEIDRFGILINPRYKIHRYLAIHLFPVELFIFVIKIFRRAAAQLQRFPRRKDFIKIQTS